MVVFALDTVVFRSGLYRRYIEPESTAGMITLAPLLADAQYKPELKNVLVLGDSRVSEGISAKIANESGHQEGVNFVVVGIPGTTPRIWHYLLREIDPARDRFVAILLMTTSFRDDQANEPLSDRTLDTAYLAPLLRLQDLVEYPLSFQSLGNQGRAFEAIALPAIPLQKDILGFLAQPLRRVGKVNRWHRDYPKWIDAYEGRSEDMPPTSELILSDGSPTAPASLKPSLTKEFEDYFNFWTKKTPVIDPSVDASYKHKWFGQIAASYRGKPTRIKAFLMPRGPYHLAMQIPFEPEGAFRELMRQRQTDLIDPTTSIALESSENFFDFLHMNARGRSAFSKVIADAQLTEKQIADVNSR